MSAGALLEKKAINIQAKNFLPAAVALQPGSRSLTSAKAANFSDSSWPMNLGCSAKESCR